MRELCLPDEAVEDRLARLKTELEMLIGPIPSATLPEWLSASREATLCDVAETIRTLQRRLTPDCASKRSASPQKWAICSVPAPLLARLLLETLRSRVGRSTNTWREWLGEREPSMARSAEATVLDEPQQHAPQYATSMQVADPGGDGPPRSWQPVESFATISIALGDAVGALCRIGRLSVGLNESDLQTLVEAAQPDFAFPIDPLDPFWTPRLHFRIGAMLLSAVLPLRGENIARLAPGSHVWIGIPGQPPRLAAPLGCIAVAPDGDGHARERKLVYLSPPAVRLLRRACVGEIVLPLPFKPLPWRDHGPPKHLLPEGELDRPAHQRYRGGYLALRRPLIRADEQIMTDGLPAPCGHLVLDAVNTLQSVPFAIDLGMLETVRRCVALAREAALARFGAKHLLPPHAAVLGINVDDKTPPRMLLLRLEEFATALDRLDRLGRYPSGFHQVYRIDYRGRLYPDSAISHQGSAIFRSCIVFRDPTPLGHNGLRWLKIHLARLSGQLDPTASEADALEWVDRHRDTLFVIGRSDFLTRRLVPYRPFKFLCRAKPKERLLFVAGCRALLGAARAKDPASFACALPIYLDGSANILQHFALLTRDEILGQELCNLADVHVVPQEEVQSVGGLREVLESSPLAVSHRADPYAEIWAVARERISAIVQATPVAEAGARVKAWLQSSAELDTDEGASLSGGGVPFEELGAAVLAVACETQFSSPLGKLALSSDTTGRKFVKTVLVRRLYGGSRFGMISAVQDDFPKIAESVSNVVELSCARYGENVDARLRRRLVWQVLAWVVGQVWAAFAEIAPRSKALLDALQSVARRAGEAGRPIRWTTPAGLQVQFAPRRAVAEKVTTGRGGVASKLFHVNLGSPVEKRRLVNGVAANVIHSFDAAHLTLAIVASRRVGDIPLMPVHDAFGVRPSDAETLVRLLPVCAYRLYERTDAETVIRDMLIETGLVEADTEFRPTIVSEEDLVHDCRAIIERAWRNYDRPHLPVVHLDEFSQELLSRPDAAALQICQAAGLSLGSLNLSDLPKARYMFS